VALASRDGSSNDDEKTGLGALGPRLVSGRSLKPFVLQQLEGPLAPRSFVLDLEELVIGRSTQAHISIDSSMISRRHLLLRKLGGEYRVEDLGSSNGVYLNGVKVHSAVLREGDTLQMGDVILVFHEGS
jgi:pSer/pThr/pTyr-binding forkhead associated (FHA) protein